MSRVQKKVLVGDTQAISLGGRLNAWCVRVLFRLRRGLRGRSAKCFSEIDLIHSVLNRRFRAGKVMVDVGAQFGESFAPFTRFGWTVLAFEPDPDPRKQTALAARAGPAVRISAKALAAEPASAADFFASDQSTGISTLVPFHPSHRAVARVEVSTLRRELADAEVTRVDFLKVDTEGHDFFVLQGFPWERGELRPRVVLCEFEDAKTLPLGYAWRDMAEFLAQRGYLVFVSEWYPIIRYGVSHRWRRVERHDEARADSASWGNLVAWSDAEEAEAFHRRAAKYSSS